MSLRWDDHWSRGVLPTVVCAMGVTELPHGRDLGPSGGVEPRGKIYIYIYIYIYIQGVTGGMCETSGECSLC